MVAAFVEAELLQRLLSREDFVTIPDDDRVDSPQRQTGLKRLDSQGQVIVLRLKTEGLLSERNGEKPFIDLPAKKNLLAGEVPDETAHHKPVHGHYENVRIYAR